MLGLYNQVTLFETRYEVHTLSIQTMLSDDEIPCYPLSQTSFKFIYRALMKIKRQNITQKNYFYVFNFDNFFLLKPNIILVDCKQNPQRWLHCWVLWELSEHCSRNLSGRKRNRIVRSFCEIICSFYLKKIPLLKASSVNLQAKVTSKWSPRKAPANISTKRPISCLLLRYESSTLIL